MFDEPLVQLWERLVPQLNSYYSFRISSGPLRLIGGERNLALAFEASGKSLVARLSPAGVSVAGTAHELRVMNWIATRLAVVPAPLTAAEGPCFAFEGRVVSVFPFVLGARADRDNSNVRRAAAQLLAEVHGHLLPLPMSRERPGHPPVARYDWSRSPLWDWMRLEAAFSGSNGYHRLLALGAAPEPAQVIVSLFPLLAEERLAAANFSANLEATRRPLRGHIHGDFYRGNILTLGEQISGLIDWDDTRPEWLAWELARAAWEFSRREDDGFDPSRAAGFIHDYRAAGGPVPESEDDLLVPLLRTVQVTESMWALTDALNGRPWDPGYMAGNNLLTLAQLRTLRRLGP